LSSGSQLISNTRTLHFPVSCYWFTENWRYSCEINNDDNCVGDDDVSNGNDITKKEKRKRFFKHSS